MPSTDAARAAWRYHPDRDALMAEAHARPFTPIAAPALVGRVANLSGETGEGEDRAHMAALCRRMGQPEPGPDSRWCVLDVGAWRLRWERHTEVSTWTFFQPLATRVEPFARQALDRAPQDWLDGFPGRILAAVRLEVRGSGEGVDADFGPDAIGSRLADGMLEVVTDFRPDADGQTRVLLTDQSGDATVVGRMVQNLLEIETYRLLAMLAFPLAGQAGRELARVERTAAELAEQLPSPSDPDADRRLLDRLAALAGEAEAQIGRTSFRFGAAAAYHDLVRERIVRLREQRVAGRQTVGEFMQRRLDPAMRTCQATAARQRAAIDRISRMAQLLNTRVEVAAEATSAALLLSMDRRAAVQLRLQQTVEGLSTAAISYYAVSLLVYPLKSLEKVWPGLDAAVAAGVLTPFVVFLVWRTLRGWRARLTGEEGSASPAPKPA